MKKGRWYHTQTLNLLRLRKGPGMNMHLVLLGNKHNPSFHCKERDLRTLHTMILELAGSKVLVGKIDCPILDFVTVMFTFRVLITG